MEIISKNNKKFIVKASSNYDNHIKKIYKKIYSSSEKLLYKNIKVPLLVEKPWGEETLIGLSKNLELWELIIQPGHQTSYHCHPKKDTLLVIINGKAQLRTENSEEILKSGAFRFIEKKACHQIKCIGDTPLILIEIENPVNKNDLVRIEDYYGREEKAYLHKSKLISREKLTEVVLLNEQKTIKYLKNQEKDHTFENKFPIHVTTNLGVTRELYTPKSILKQFRDISLGFAAVLEILVPSLERIEKAKQKIDNKLNKFLVKLDKIAKERSGDRIRGNSRDIHGNVWDEIFIVLSGEMTFVEFEPTKKEKEIMRQNNGSIYELSSVEKIRKKNFNNLSIKKMETGDIFFSEAGCAHGVFESKDALYLVFINKNKDFEYWMKEFWGKDSKKYKLNKKIAKELKEKNTKNISSYWGEYSDKR